MLKNFFIKWKKLILTLLPVYSIILTILITLGVFNKISYSWSAGFLLSVFAGTMAFICIKVSIKTLLNEQNPYLYVFFSILRLGIYVVPFLISFYLPMYINIFSVMIGLGSIILTSFFINLLANNSI